MRLKATSFSLLVLNAKGGETNAKATGSTATCEFKKCLFLTRLFYQNPLDCKEEPSNCKTTLLWGRNLSYGKRGAFGF
jgi:hypothetical protein